MKTQYTETDQTVEKLVFTVSEVAEMLNVHKNTVYKLVKQDVLASKKIGTEIRISKKSFYQWLNSN